MPLWVFAIILVVAIALTGGSQLGWRIPEDDHSAIRQRLEAQGLAVERVRLARGNVTAPLVEQYGRSRYGLRRFYEVLLKDGGVTVKQIWMAEYDRLVRIS